MRLRLMAILGILLFAIPVNAVEKSALKSLESQKDKVSYSIGSNIGNNLKKQSFDINPAILVQGLKDSYSGEKTLMTEKEMNETMMNFQKEMMQKEIEKNKELGVKNKKEGDAFLAENTKKEGVVTLPSGLQYKVMTEGKGKMPKTTDIVTVNYKGALIDGTEFDSSYKRGQPATFPVNGVIPGWTEALQLMKEGSKWQLFIPSNLAYGDKGAGRDIGPNAVLIFDVELISVAEPPKPEAKSDTKPELKPETKLDSKPDTKSE